MTDRTDILPSADNDESRLATLMAAPALPTSDVQFVAQVQKKLEQRRARQRWAAPALSLIHI